jgi:hypothetical protein
LRKNVVVFNVGLDDDRIFNPDLLFLLGKPELSRFRPEVVIPVKPLFSNRLDVRSVAGVVVNPYYLFALFSATRGLLKKTSQL